MTNESKDNQKEKPTLEKGGYQPKIIKKGYQPKPSNNTKDSSQCQPPEGGSGSSKKE